MTSPHQFDSADAYRRVLAAIDKAARSVGRQPSEIDLVCVTKSQPWERVEPVVRAGARIFGENRVQEAAARWGERKAAITGLELRLIGPLQTNKAAEAAALFDVVETLDREKLARALSDAFLKTGRVARLYVQVNTGEEPQKSGVAPAEVDGFLARVRRDYGLSVEGLMCVPPLDEEPALHFALLRKLALRNGLSRLSMGMSSDFETAVRFGATSVRVGSRIFGGRG